MSTSGRQRSAASDGLRFPDIPSPAYSNTPSTSQRNGSADIFSLPQIASPGSAPSRPWTVSRLSNRSDLPREASPHGFDFEEQKAPKQRVPMGADAAVDDEIARLAASLVPIATGSMPLFDVPEEEYAAAPDWSGHVEVQVVHVTPHSRPPVRLTPFGERHDAPASSQRPPVVRRQASRNKGGPATRGREHGISDGTTVAASPSQLANMSPTEPYVPWTGPKIDDPVAAMGETGGRRSRSSSPPQGVSSLTRPLSPPATASSRRLGSTHNTLPGSPQQQLPGHSAASQPRGGKLRTHSARMRWHAETLAQQFQRAIPPNALAMHSGLEGGEQLRDKVLELMLREPRAQEGLLRRLRAAHRSIFGPPHPKRRTYAEPRRRPRLLDGAALLAACGAASPEEALSGAASSRNFVSIDPASLAPFVALRILDLADNGLVSLAPLAALTALQSLNLSSNGITALGELPPGAFPALRRLELGYNQLPGDELLASGLADLPQLAELGLAGNELAALPHLEGGHFTALAKLQLAGNRLRSGALAALAQLRRLEHLDLSDNRVSEVPDELIQAPSATAGSAIVLSAGPAAGRPAAFPCLQTLDLGRNCVAAYDGVAPLAGVSSLQRLVLVGNPCCCAPQPGSRATSAPVSLGGDRSAAGTAASGARTRPLSGALGAAHFEVVIDPEGASPAKRAMGEVLARHMRVVDERTPSSTATQALATVRQISEVPPERVDAVFDGVDDVVRRLQANIERAAAAAGRAPPPAPAPGMTGGLDSPASGTFMTGVMFEDDSLPDDASYSGTESSVATEDSNPLWTMVEDPTTRMALALGLDPDRLASGEPGARPRAGGDVRRAVAALKFALQHPLVEVGEGLRPAPHHLSSTAVSRSRQQRKPSQPLPDKQLLLPDPRDKTPSVGRVLSSMSSKLAQLRDNIDKDGELMTSWAAAGRASAATIGTVPAHEEDDVPEPPAARAAVAALVVDDLDAGSDSDLSDLEQNMVNELHKGGGGRQRSLSPPLGRSQNSSPQPPKEMGNRTLGDQLLFSFETSKNGTKPGVLKWTETETRPSVSGGGPRGA